MRRGICCRWSCTGVGMRNIWSAVGLQALRDRAVLRQVDAHLRLQGAQVTTLQLPSCFMGLCRPRDAGAGACRLWALSMALRQGLCWPGSGAGVGGWGGGVALGGLLRPEGGQAVLLLAAVVAALGICHRCRPAWQQAC